MTVTDSFGLSGADTIQVLIVSLSANSQSLKGNKETIIINPNPFNGQTRISFDLLEDAVVSLYITDATGRIHDKLVEQEYISSGIYNYTWDGEGRSTGIYFITLQAQIGQNPTVIFSRKMIYLK